MTPDKKVHVYAVPFYDIMTDRKHNKMIFPWCVDGIATQYSGIVNFSIRFFIAQREVVIVNDYIDAEDATEDTTEIVYKLIYNLTTLPA
jgi:hypothetical protein